MSLDVSPVKILNLAVNSHAELFSLAAYLCLHQGSMSVNALSRLLEADAKPVNRLPFYL